MAEISARTTTVQNFMAELLGFAKEEECHELIVEALRVVEKILYFALLLLRK